MVTKIMREITLSRNNVSDAFLSRARLDGRLSVAHPGFLRHEFGVAKMEDNSSGDDEIRHLRRECQIEEERGYATRVSQVNGP